MHIFKSIYRWYYKNLKFRRNRCIIGSKVIFNNNTHFEGHNKIGDNTYISQTNVGLGTYISNQCSLINGNIGRFCSIAPKVECILGNHPLSPFVSTHPAFFSTSKQAGFTFVSNQLFEERKFLKNGKSFVIGNDVWLGYGVKILEGISIGDGVVVATGSIITKNIPPYEIWGGIPAKKIADRFPEETKQKLQMTKWWEKDFNWLKQNAHLFQNINSFIYNK